MENFGEIQKMIYQQIRDFYQFIRTLPYIGNRRYCPVCEQSSSKFKAAGLTKRQNAKCVFCGSLERHRLVWEYFRVKTNLFSKKPIKMLHIAPERAFVERLAVSLGSGYITADLFDPTAMVKMDITNIQFPDETFDVIYCSHVLEHVPNDRQAMREFNRVLKNDGWAVLLVPIGVEKTYEDPSKNTPELRLLAFGQEDHVRIYGRDFLERLQDAGFQVDSITANDLCSKEDIIYKGLQNSDEIYYCTKT